MNQHFQIFLKIFESVDSFEFEEKGTKLAKNTVDLISLFTKSVGIDLSKFTDKPFENLEKMLDDKKLKKTEEYLNSGAIICFDDFERKSKDIDLNDLFGFITQLTLNFNCKVVIILNDDVFEGEEKKIFSNVKEKSVSKFLKYEPSIKDLFDSIFDNDKEYRKLEDYKEIILKTIEETQELNARIYIQVLDNLVEWIEKNQETNDYVLRCLILVNINFILNHQTYYFNDDFQLPLIFLEFNKFPLIVIKGFMNNLDKFKEYKSKMELMDSLKEFAEEKYKERRDSSYALPSEGLKEDLELIEKYEEYFWLYVKYEIHLEFRKNLKNEQLNRINNFIETGILINE